MGKLLQRTVVSILLGVGIIFGFQSNASATAYSFQGGQIRAVFGPHDSTDTQSPYYQLYKFLQSAKKTIHCSCYEFNIETLAQILANKAETMPVHIVLGEKPASKTIPVDSDEPWDAWQILTNSKVNLTLAANKSGIMHNKFCVIDSQKVWTGSANFTYSSMFRDFNNGIMVSDHKVALNYLTEFKEEERGNFGSAYQPFPTPHPEVDLGQSTIETYFSPDDRVQSQILSEIKAAQNSIEFMIFAFSSEKMLDSILAKMEQGVRVRGIFDNRFRNSDWSKKVFEALKAKGAEVKYDDMTNLVHHKVMIIDRKTVITGSYNFSQNAEKENDENILIIHNPRVAQKYNKEFWILWDMF